MCTLVTLGIAYSVVSAVYYHAGSALCSAVYYRAGSLLCSAVYYHAGSALCSAVYYHASSPLCSAVYYGGSPLHSACIVVQTPAFIFEILYFAKTYFQNNYK